MKDRAMGLEEVALTTTAMQLAPGGAAGMTIGAEITEPHPALIRTVRIRAEMLRGIHLARPSPRGHDAGWRATGWLGYVLVGLLTGGTEGRAGKARKGLRDPRALAGWWYTLGWPRDACGVTTGPGRMQHAAQPEQTQQHQLGEKEAGYHRVAPFHGGEMGALYPFCRLLNYPHDRGTRPLGETSPCSSAYALFFPTVMLPLFGLIL